MLAAAVCSRQLCAELARLCRATVCDAAGLSRQAGWRDKENLTAGLRFPPRPPLLLSFLLLPDAAACRAAGPPPARIHPKSADLEWEKWGNRSPTFKEVILVDATFFTGKYKGTLMMVLVVDPEGQLVPLAFALAESENNSSWSLFMKLVRRNVLGPSRQVCMISDRHHGLLNCVNDHLDGFPPLVHRWCMRHFPANMWCRHKKKEVIEKLKILCCVCEEKEFDEKLKDLEKILNDRGKEC
ncbi:hypothetical protein C2845_PM11G05580 [Panicum miliaceum]|uniref:MULE transposase domain-containing protein n=1 Tax=Panicum miliaceum TaxID=4540 RepID=A0A3L6RMH3_PANMI|nr:hypothetical protein C2845_PM11G05580 [Panicum miliaceum]